MNHQVVIEFEKLSLGSNTSILVTTLGSILGHGHGHGLMTWMIWGNPHGKLQLVNYPANPQKKRYVEVQCDTISMSCERF